MTERPFDYDLGAVVHIFRTVTPVRGAVEFDGEVVEDGDPDQILVEFALSENNPVRFVFSTITGLSTTSAFQLEEVES